MSAETASAPMTGPPQGGSGARGDGAFRRVVAWFLRTQAIRDARAGLPAISDSQTRLLGRARLCRELAERVLQAVDPLRHGSGSALGLDLHRQGIYWALLAADPAAPPSPAPAFQDVWQRSAERVGSAGVLESELAELDRILCVEPSFAKYADLTEQQIQSALELTGPLLDRLIDAADGPLIALRRLLIQRAVRTVAFVLLVVGLLAVVIPLLIPKKPNLAQGKPWSTSSSMYPCYPEKGDCGGVRTRILFHTRDDKSPWFEYDLGKNERFSSLTIRNRSDYGPERAVPLIVEISKDRLHYDEVARHDETFNVWKPSFPTKEARYVRLRVARQSFLHLESVEVHP